MTVEEIVREENFKFNIITAAKIIISRHLGGINTDLLVVKTQYTDKTKVVLELFGVSDKCKIDNNFITYSIRYDRLTRSWSFTELLGETGITIGHWEIKGDRENERGNDKV